MFFFLILQDQILVHASHLAEDLEKIIRKLLVEKYIGKMLSDQGMCISLGEFEIKQSEVCPGEGDLLVRVIAEMVIFAPLPGEVLTGRILKNFEDGLIVSLNFIDVLIPKRHMKKPEIYDVNEKTWVWRFDGVDYFYDEGEVCRFRVTETLFSKSEEEHRNFPVIGSMEEEGLGLIQWWD